VAKRAKPTDVQFLDGIADLNFKMETPVNKPKNSAELVEWYEKSFKQAADRVRAMSPEQLGTPIEFFGVFNLPAVAYLGFLNNHSIRHRGELATYLRPMGSKVPSIYGGSYDEPFPCRSSFRLLLVINCTFCACATITSCPN
jgi:hypothetical protein